MGGDRNVHEALRSCTLIRIFIIDPQPLVATALQHFFAATAGFDVVGTAQNVRTLALQATHPEFILVCQEHGSADICDMVIASRALAPAAKICVVACHPHPELLPQVVKAGADGYAVKDVDPRDLVAAIRGVHAGTAYIDPRVADRARIAPRGTSRARKSDALSLREIDVLKLIAEGYSNREISIALSLSEKTVKNHVSRIFTKLRITARTQAVVHAIKVGIA